jgi:hypothetical protein
VGIPKRALAAALLASGLGGCVAVWGDGHKVTHKDSHSIVVESDPSYAGPGQIDLIAEQHCQGNGARATLQSEKRTVLGIDVRRYHCSPVSSPARSAVALLRESLQRFQARDWAQAADRASAAIDAGSLTVTQASAAHTIRGYCRLVQGRIGDARADIDRALQLRPDFKPALQLKALLEDASRGQRRAPRPPRARDDDELQPPIIQF